MTTYRERLTAPVSWWLAALAFGLVWGWVMLVVTTWPIAIVTALVVGGACAYAVHAYGSLTIRVDDEGLSVGRDRLATAYVGGVEPLHREDYRHRLGTGADARAHLLTRPYVDRGVLVRVDDPADAVPHWIISSRRPDALAEALGQTGHPDPQQIGDASRGEEA